MLGLLCKRRARLCFVGGSGVGRGMVSAGGGGVGGGGAPGHQEEPFHHDLYHGHDSSYWRL